MFHRVRDTFKIERESIQLACGFGRVWNALVTRTARSKTNWTQMNAQSEQKWHEFWIGYVMRLFFKVSFVYIYLLLLSTDYIYVVDCFSCRNQSALVTRVVNIYLQGVHPVMRNTSDTNMYKSFQFRLRGDWIGPFSRKIHSVLNAVLNDSHEPVLSGHLFCNFLRNISVNYRRLQQKFTGQIQNVTTVEAQFSTQGNSEFGYFAKVAWCKWCSRT
jgi:hypothetical protein